MATPPRVVARSAAIAAPTPGPGPWRLAGERVLANPLAVGSLVVLALLVLAAVLAPVLAPYDPAFQDYGAVFANPSPAHWLGADNLGRDTLSRLLYGARTSLSVGIFSQAILVAIGVPVGALAGWLRGRGDNLLMRFVDVVYAFPDLLLIILLRSIFGGSIYMIFVAIGLVEWTTLARLTRAQALSLREREYVLAARALGARWHEVLFRHLLPNGLGPLVVAMVFGIPRAIFAEAALSYIGIGVEPPTPSWGGMVQDGYQAIFNAPHLLVAPSVTIAVVTLAFTFLADALRDALDPRTSVRF